MNKSEIKRICSKQPEEVTVVEYEHLKLSALNQLGRVGGTCHGIYCSGCCLYDKDSSLSCAAVELTNPQESIKKLQDWHKENTLKVDWSKVPVDTRVLVWDNGWENNKVKRHFAKFEGGKIYTWTNGETSWTATSDGYITQHWDNAELEEGKNEKAKKNTNV